MARPPVEWPIPAYVVELRERVVATFRVPGRALAALIPAPVAPALVGGRAVVSLCFGSGRRLSSVGANPALATEFTLAEVVTPVLWQGACRPTLRGNFLLHCSTGAHGLARLVRTALNAPCRWESLDVEAQLALPRERSEAPWPADSVFSSHEAAEAHLLHPEACFVAAPHGGAVNAVPIHQYARATIHLVPHHAAALRIAGVLSVPPEELEFDHMFLQKRCTHTWSFPPERILTARGTPRWAEPVLRAGREPLGVQR